jgi:hypothetical protein
MTLEMERGHHAREGAMASKPSRKGSELGQSLAASPPAPLLLPLLLPAPLLLPLLLPPPSPAGHDPVTEPAVKVPLPIVHAILAPSAVSTLGQ